MWVDRVNWQGLVKNMLCDAPAPRFPVTDDMLRESILRPDRNVCDTLQERIATLLADVDLCPTGDQTRLRSAAVAALGAAAMLEWATTDPDEVLLDAAAACARFAAETGVAATLAEDMLCAHMVRRVTGFGRRTGDRGAEVEKRLRELSGSVPLLVGLDGSDDDELEAAGTWLGERALPNAVDGRFPLRKLVVSQLCIDDPRQRIARLGQLAPVLAGIDADEHASHLVDMFECYAGWMAGHGGYDADARTVLGLLDRRAPRSELRQLGRAAARFFTLLADVDSKAKPLVRKAPQLKRSLLIRARRIGGRVGAHA